MGEDQLINPKRNFLLPLEKTKVLTSDVLTLIKKKALMREADFGIKLTSLERNIITSVKILPFANDEEYIGAVSLFEDIIEELNLCELKNAQMQRILAVISYNDLILSLDLETIENGPSFTLLLKRFWNWKSIAYIGSMLALAFEYFYVPATMSKAN